MELWQKSVVSVKTKFEKETTSKHGKTTLANENNLRSPLIYKINDSPPILVTFLCGLQQSLLSLGSTIILPVLVSEAVCAEESAAWLQRLTSTTIFINGISTVTQAAIGIRIPIFQGISASYIVPLITLRVIDKDRCNLNSIYGNETNGRSEEQLADELTHQYLRELMVPLMIAGVVHFLIGATGLVGLLMRFIGPVTVVPTILLVGIHIVRSASNLAETHWGVSGFTWSVGVIMSLYLANKPMSVPFYTREKGFHIVRFPFHQVFAVLIALLAGTILSTILTYSNCLTDDQSSKMYKARIDAKAAVVSKTGWFRFPYPGQYGYPMYSSNALLGFFIAVIASILDSIGDYYAAATVCRVPPPPSHAVNRGIAVEGLVTILAGSVGCGHATSTSGSSIGVLGLTKVACRKVLFVAGAICIFLGVLEKFSAAFVSIPSPVLGGVFCMIISVFIGVNLTNLRVIDLSSNRNLAIIGTGIFMGLLVPRWTSANGDQINTGNAGVDNVIRIMLGNPNFCGTFIACFLDNTVPGTEEERGITSWKEVKEDDALYLEGYEVYEPPVPDRFLRSRIAEWLPILPYKGKPYNSPQTKQKRVQRRIDFKQLQLNVANASSSCSLSDV